MRLGLKMPQLDGVGRSTIRGFCENAERFGYDSLLVLEHLIWPHHPKAGYAGVPGDTMPERYRSVLAPLELLAAAAAWTERISLGSNVLIAGYHRPVELATRLAAIDVLSEGRVFLGIGVGWSPDEHDVSEVPFARRGSRMDDFIPAMLACWRPDPVEYDGPVFQIPKAHIAPKSVQDPRPKIYAGVLDSKKGLERMVRHFDGWQADISRTPIAHIRETADRLNEQRTPEQGPLSIQATVWPEHVYATDSPADPWSLDFLLEQVEACREAGFDELIVECSFWRPLTRAEDWVGVPERLLPALEAAHRA